MRCFPLILILTILATVGLSAERRIITVVGAEGTSEYEEVFRETAEKWRSAAVKGEAAFDLIGLDEEKENSAASLRETIAAATEPELWIVLIGHGSFDTRTAKFNVHGSDFTDGDLADWVRDYPGQLAVVNTASSSGSFLRTLSGENRVIITATKNEAELFYTRFGIYFADAVSGLTDADLDNDGQVSLLESFLYASDRVAKFYEGEGRLATEHAVLDDNGDSMGSRSEWFDGTTATRAPNEKSEPDGELAAQKVLVLSEVERRLPPKIRARRDELEREVKRLRRDRDNMAEDDYYGALEPLLLEIARIYGEAADS